VNVPGFQVVDLRLTRHDGPTPRLNDLPRTVIVDADLYEE
jgi:hypothetical protein